MRLCRALSRSRSAVAGALLGAVLGSVLTGCGGSGDSSPRAAAPTSTAPTAAASAVPLQRLVGDGFSVGLPGKAESTTQTVPTEAGDIKIVLYTATDPDGGTFVVAMNDYPAGTTIDLDGAVRGAAANVGGTVRESAKTEFLGNPARDARYTAAPQGQPVTIWARIVQKGRRLFQLQYFVPKSGQVDPPPVFDQVLDTVKFEEHASS